jgi:hypothetical protein
MSALVSFGERISPYAFLAVVAVLVRCSEMGWSLREPAIPLTSSRSYSVPFIELCLVLYPGFPAHSLQNSLRYGSYINVEM